MFLAANVAIAAEDLGPRPRGGAGAKEWSDRAWAMSAEIPPLIDSDKAEDLAIALDKTRALLKARLTFATGSRGDGVIKHYFDKGKFQEVVDLADFGILIHPEETAQVIMLQRFKANALTQLKRADEAVAAAKAYYNIASMTGTADAMQFLMTTLIMADPQNVRTAERFKQEQITGAQPPSPDKLKEPQPRTSVLESIKIDPKPYEAEIAKRNDVSSGTLIGKGNLLLLADRLSEAQAAFDAAYLIATPRNVAGAAEDVARAMRAVDGSIGRANAWIESLRPTASVGDPGATSGQTDAVQVK